MIYDNLSDIGRYKGLHKGLDAAIAWLQNNDPSVFADGKNPIDGDAVYAKVGSYVTTEPHEKDFEEHRDYIDIQYVFEGAENCEFTYATDIEMTAAYDKGRDMLYYKAEADGTVLLDRTKFAIFFPEEGHKPALKAAGFAKSRKAILKVRY